MGRCYTERPTNKTEGFENLFETFFQSVDANLDRFDGSRRELLRVFEEFDLPGTSLDPYPAALAHSSVVP